MSETLFDPGFVRELEALRRRLSVRSRSGGAGEHLSKKRGGAAEFLEHRPYVPGDDPRRIDWLAFARTGEPVLKTFRAEEDSIVRLVVDASASLNFGAPISKLFHAKRLAACMGYLALASSERTQVLGIREVLETETDPIRGRGALPRLLGHLGALEAKGGTDLAAAIESVVQRSPRPGMLVILSDFFDGSSFERSILHASSRGHDVVLVQVLDPEEVSPSFDGDIALEDAETGELVELTVDEGSVRAYLNRLRREFDALTLLSKRLRLTYVRTLTTDSTIDVVRKILSRGIDT